MPLRRCPRCHEESNIPSNKFTCCLKRGCTIKQEIARGVIPTLTEPAGGFATNAPPKPAKYTHPSGWEPHVEEHADHAVAVSKVTEVANPDDEWLIAGWKLDPTRWRIVRGSMVVNRWTISVPIGSAAACKCSEPIAEPHYEERWQYQYKARLDPIDPVKVSELESLCEEIKAHVFLPGPHPEGEDGFVVAIADTQMGKGDGDGASGTAKRFLVAIPDIKQRIADLRAVGRPLRTGYVFGMGDLIENCAGHYAQQAFRTTLNRRDQVKVTRRLILRALEQWAPLFDRLVVAAVGGNHGENRDGSGKSFTDFADNDDVAIFEQVQEVLESNPTAYGHVSFLIPNDELTLTVNVGGKVVGLTHGHIAGKGANVAQKITNWWARQAHGQQPIGEAEILITGHYHHLLVIESGSKTHIQCPALEGGSDWWRNLSGQESRPGMLTLRIGANVSPAGWGDLHVA